MLFPGHWSFSFHPFQINNKMRKEFDQRFYRAILAGLVSYLPGMDSILTARGGKNTLSARYCYAVWMRHLLLLSKYTDVRSLKKIAEIGTGHSIGTGLCALLTGAEQYTGLDVMKFDDRELNIQILCELASLLKERTPIPGNMGFPGLKPDLESLEFPGKLLPDEWLIKTLHPDRLKAIEHDLAGYPERQGSFIRHSEREQGTYDLIFSQYVMEHIEQPEESYRDQYSLLKAGGLVSHTIDFWCHGKSRLWNGHWALSAFIWKLIKGRRLYLLNRMAASEHLELIKLSGFKLLANTYYKDHNGLKRSGLHRNFNHLIDEDLITREVYVIAQRY
jgi:SAM-dependent methyltransferase